MYSVANQVQIEDVAYKDIIDYGDEEERENAEDKEKEVDELKVVSDDEYFKRFFSFSLFCYIPPTQDETHKSSLILMVVDVKIKYKKTDDRNNENAAEKIEKIHLKELEVDCLIR